MSSIARFRHIVLAAIASLLTTTFVADPVFAFGRVKWKSTTFEERKSSKSWRLELAIYLPRPPGSAYVPMKFEFQPVAYYERAMVDGDKLVERVVPLHHNQPLVESVDVGFLDPGTAQIMSRTKFTFKVTRAHDYKAGEYKVTVMDARSGRKIGRPTKLKFEGENEVIDRRSIVFSGKKKEKAEDEEEAGEDAAAAAEEPSGDELDTEEAEFVDLQDDGDDPPPVEGKPGGCGCATPGSRSPGALAALVALLGAIVASGRRRGVG